MNFKLRLLALLLLVMMVFTSCSLESVLQYIPWFASDSDTTQPTETTPPDEPVIEPVSNLINIDDFTRKAYSMQRSELLAMYTLTQEDVDATLALIDQMVAGALPAPDGDPNVAAMTIEEWDAIYVQFEESFYHIAQQMTIATIIYYCNMSDEVASERKTTTTDMFYDVQDKYNQSLRELYYNSPMKDELFEGWSEEEIRSMLEYDPDIMEVKKEIERLETLVDNLDDKAVDYNDVSVELYKQLILERQKIARFNKFDNYYTYASKNVYSRDYSSEDLAVFHANVVKYIVPELKSVYERFNAWRDLSKVRQDTFIYFVDKDFDLSKKNYLLLYLNSLEGSMGENMRSMFLDKNCIFSNNANSHPTAFCTYLYEDGIPFCLFGDKGQTANTIVHEIGHYYADKKNSSLSNYDLLETHSQGNEYLFIKFCEDQMNAAIYDCVKAYNFFNSIYIIIMSSIVDEFEQRVYALDDETIASMTSEDFDAIMTEICEPYGGADWVSTNLSDPYEYWRFVAISNPVYYISYGVSAVASLEIFAIAESDVDGEGYEAAKSIYTTLVEGVTEEDGFLNALKKAGLYTPFEEEAFKKVAATMKK